MDRGTWWATYSPRDRQESDTTEWLNHNCQSIKYKSLRILSPEKIIVLFILGVSVSQYPFLHLSDPNFYLFNIQMRSVQPLSLLSSEISSFFFWPHCLACRISGPWLGIRLGPQLWRSQVLTTGPPENEQILSPLHCNLSLLALSPSIHVSIPMLFTTFLLDQECVGGSWDALVIKIAKMPVWWSLCIRGVQAVNSQLTAKPMMSSTKGG